MSLDFALKDFSRKKNQTYPYLKIYPAGDLNHDSQVNLSDFAIFADHWLAGVE